MNTFFKVGDKVKVTRKCEFQEPEDNNWNDAMFTYIGKEGVVVEIDRRYGVNVEFENGDDWLWFPSQSIELVTDEYTKDNNKTKQQYVVLVWGTEEDGEVHCGKPVYDMKGCNTFIGTKNEAKEYRDYMRNSFPDSTYKIAKYPFVIEFNNNV